MIRKLVKLIRSLKKKETSELETALETQVAEEPKVKEEYRDTILTTIDINEFCDKLNLESDTVRTMIIFSYQALLDTAHSPLKNKVLKDLYEARKINALDKLLGAYLVGLYDICKKHRQYKNDPLCVHLRKLEKRLILLEATQLKGREAVKERSRIKKDKNKILKLYDEYEKLARGAS